MKFSLGEKVKYDNRILVIKEFYYGWGETTCVLESDTGCYYCNVSENLLQKLTTVYSVKHPGNNKVFNFKSNLELQNGDKVLCDTVFGIALATVVGINNDFPATKWIISKLDTTEYDKAIEEERREREKEDIRTRIQIMEKELAAEKERLNQL